MNFLKGEILLDTLKLAHKIVDILDEKQGEDILFLDISEVTSIAEYFIICTGSSVRQVQALLKAVKTETKKEFKINPRIEGEAQAGWMLADYDNLVLHIFSPDRREFYRLEELWSEGKTLLHLQ